MELGSLSYRMVKSLLKLAPPATSDIARDTVATRAAVVAPDVHKFARPMSVYATALNADGKEDVEQLPLLH